MSRLAPVFLKDARDHGAGAARADVPDRPDGRHPAGGGAKVSFNIRFTSSRCGRCESGLVKLKPHSQYMQLKLHNLQSSGKRLTPSEVPRRRLFTGPKIILLNNITLRFKDSVFFYKGNAFNWIGA